MLIGQPTQIMWAVLQNNFETLSTNQVKGHLAMLAFSGLVAGSFALGVRVANDISPAAFTLLRFVVAVSVLGTFVLTRVPIPKSVFAAPWR